MIEIGIEEIWRKKHWSNRLLLMLCATIFVSILGFATFGLHPEWLSLFPGDIGEALQRFYAISFRLFGEGQSWLLGFALLVYLFSVVRLKWIASGIAVYLVSLGMELGGTLYGIPFGKYYYTSWMGSRIFDHVPFVIPLSWYAMAIPSYAIALHFSKGKKWYPVFVGALLLTLWDVSLDPAMSYLTSYWVWKPLGNFYGMPLQNWMGWYITSFLLMLVLRVSRTSLWLSKCSISWLGVYYVLNILLPFGMLTVSIFSRGTLGIVILNVFVFFVCMYILHPGRLREFFRRQYYAKKANT